MSELKLIGNHFVQDCTLWVPHLSERCCTRKMRDYMKA